MVVCTISREIFDNVIKISLLLLSSMGLKIVEIRKATLGWVSNDGKKKLLLLKRLDFLEEICTHLPVFCKYSRLFRYKSQLVITQEKNKLTLLQPRSIIAGKTSFFG